MAVETNTALTTPTGLLGHDGSGPGKVTPAKAAQLLQGGFVATAVKVAAYNAVCGECVLVNVSAGGFVVTLPATPAVGDAVKVALAAGDWSVSNLTVGRNGSTIAGVAADYVVDGGLTQLVFRATSSSAWMVELQSGGTAGQWKPSVRAVATVNATIATAYEHGDTLDGITLATGNRILLAGQTSAAANGIYIVQASGTPIRATDADGAGDLLAGVTVYVEEGSVNARTHWTLTTTGTITPGSTSQTWVRRISSSSESVVLTKQSLVTRRWQMPLYYFYNSTNNGPAVLTEYLMWVRYPYDRTAAAWCFRVVTGQVSALAKLCFYQVTDYDNIGAQFEVKSSYDVSASNTTHAFTTTSPWVPGEWYLFGYIFDTAAVTTSGRMGSSTAPHGGDGSSPSNPVFMYSKARANLGVALPSTCDALSTYTVINSTNFGMLLGWAIV